MLLDEALDVLDYISFQLVNDEATPLAKTEMLLQLDAFEEMIQDHPDRSKENHSCTHELISMLDGLNSELRKKRDLLQMISSALKSWKM